MSIISKADFQCKRTDCMLHYISKSIIPLVYLIRLNIIFLNFTTINTIFTKTYFFGQLVSIFVLQVPLLPFRPYLPQHSLPFVSILQIFSVLQDLMQFSRWYAHWLVANNQVSSHLKDKIILIFSLNKINWIKIIEII